jgi:hypothetical protein
VSGLAAGGDPKLTFYRATAEFDKRRGKRGNGEENEETGAEYSLEAIFSDGSP